MGKYGLGGIVRVHGAYKLSFRTKYLVLWACFTNWGAILNRKVVSASRWLLECIVAVDRVVILEVSGGQRWRIQRSAKPRAATKQNLIAYNCFR